MICEDGIYYYCNISLLFIYDDNEVFKYIDYDLDIKVYSDMIYIFFDEDEYEKYWKEMNYSEVIDCILYNYVEELKGWIW